jgi:hypothetical protein
MSQSLRGDAHFAAERNSGSTYRAVVVPQQCGRRSLPWVAGAVGASVLISNGSNSL